MILGIFGFLNMSFVDFLDIILVAFLIFFLFRWIRGSSAMTILITVVLMLIVRVIVEALNMKLMSALMGAVVDIGILALIVLFQPEIRHSLFKLGGKGGIARNALRLFDRLFGLQEDRLADASVREIAEACWEMSDQKEGALIVLTKQNSLEYIIETGDRVDARISKRLILNIFFKNSPLHDGAMVISKKRIKAAGCILPVSHNLDIPKELGLRHRAGLGISQASDAIAIIVSEETGRISVANKGEFRLRLSAEELEAVLAKEM